MLCFLSGVCRRTPGSSQYGRVSTDWEPAAPPGLWDMAGHAGGAASLGALEARDALLALPCILVPLMGRSLMQTGFAGHVFLTSSITPAGCRAYWIPLPNNLSYS